MSNPVNRLAILLPAIVLLAGAAPAPVPPRSGGSDASPDAARKALDQTVTLDFGETPLAAALAQIAEKTKVQVVLDRTSIQQLGLDPNDMPVSARLKDVKLKAGLRTVLAHYNLAYAAIGDTIIVTTEEVAQQRLLRQSVEVDADKQPLADVLKRLGRSTGINLVIDPRQAKAAQAAVTLQIDDVPLETAVRLLSELAGLKPVRMGNVVFVTSEERADRLRADGDLVPVAPSAMAGDRPTAIMLPAGGGAAAPPPPPVAPAVPAPRNAP
jgi:type II secretory pathway component GspD/PulD (secretin)